MFYQLIILNGESGFLHGQQQAAIDFQNKSSFNPVCVKHISYYCAGYVKGYNVTWNNLAANGQTSNPNPPTSNSISPYSIRIAVHLCFHCNTSSMSTSSGFSYSRLQSASNGIHLSLTGSLNHLMPLPPLDALTYVT
jgi:hypothetical protein